MRKHHGVQQSETSGYRGRSEEREGGKKVRAEENSAQGVQIGLVAEIEPIGNDALHNETAGEGIQDEKPCQLRHDLTGSLYADCSFLRIGFGLPLDGR